MICCLAGGAVENITFEPARARSLAAFLEVQHIEVLRLVLQLEVSLLLQNLCLTERKDIVFGKELSLMGLWKRNTQLNLFFRRAFRCLAINEISPHHWD
jgi:hypothetical protein